MEEEIRQKFCRDCYTTTPHKVVVVTNTKDGDGYKKIICLKCSGTRVFKKALPKKKVSYEELLEI